MKHLVWRMIWSFGLHRIVFGVMFNWTSYIAIQSDLNNTVFYTYKALNLIPKAANTFGKYFGPFKYLLHRSFFDCIYLPECGLLRSGLKSGVTVKLEVTLNLYFILFFILSWKNITKSCPRSGENLSVWLFGTDSPTLHRALRTFRGSTTLWKKIEDTFW